MIRAEKAAGTPFGLTAKEYEERGELVPDDIVIDRVRARLVEPDTAEGFVLDGFPRTFAQARALDEMLAEIERELSVVLEFRLPEALAEQRLLARGRADDTPETIRKRLEGMRVPEDVIAYYRAKGNLVGIDAAPAVDEVFAAVQSVLETAAKKEQQPPRPLTPWSE